MITGKTNICGLVGSPIDHSVSPRIHNAAFKRLNLDFVYIPFRVQKDDLKQAVRGLKVLDVRGFNVTMPHKINVIQYLDELDPLAEKIGAVNTVINNDGKLKGFNTDGIGYLKSLEQHDINVKGKQILLLGAGGAGRAIAFILVQNGALLTIINRTKSKAQKISHDLLQMFGREPRVLDLTRENFAEMLKSTDILVNATNIGMDPNVDLTLVGRDLLKPDILVSDIVYSPIKTKLLRDAETIGAKTVSGIDMVVWQAALAFKMWTGYPPPVDIMRKEVDSILNRHL